MSAVTGNSDIHRYTEWT